MIDFLKRPVFKRIAVFAVMGFILFLLKDMLNLFLLTFIFTFLFYNAQKFISNKVSKFLPVQQKYIVITLYLIFSALAIFVIYKYLPPIIKESSEVINSVKEYLNKSQQSPLEKYISTYIKDFDIKSYMSINMSSLTSSITSIGKWGFNIVVSFVLSLYFLLEKNKVSRFLENFKNSKLSAFYDEIHFFGEKFTHSFGKVIQAQITIAFCNAILSVIALSFMRFPNVLGLGLMIFLLGMVPVAGTFISLIPLSILAFKIGGPQYVIYMVIMIAVLHALENYLLNPKLVSARIDLPVFFTFMILIVSEHFMGIWGLIIGIPIFMFVLDVLDIKSVKFKGEEGFNKLH